MRLLSSRGSPRHWRGEPFSLFCNLFRGRDHRLINQAKKFTLKVHVFDRQEEPQEDQETTPKDGQEEYSQEGQNAQDGPQDGTEPILT